MSKKNKNNMFNLFLEKRKEIIVSSSTLNTQDPKNLSVMDVLNKNNKKIKKNNFYSNREHSDSDPETSTSTCEKTKYPRKL